MPRVNDKEFPYTAKGKRDAEEYAKMIRPAKRKPAGAVAGPAKKIKPAKRKPAGRVTGPAKVIKPVASKAKRAEMQKRKSAIKKVK